MYKGKMATQIKYKLHTVFGESALSFKTVHTGVAKFKCGQMSCGDVNTVVDVQIR